LLQDIGARANLTVDGLRELSLAKGIDRATAALYQYVRERSEHRLFLRAADATEGPPALSGRIPRLLILPGAFHAEHRHTGADGVRVFELATELGWLAERVAVPSLAPMAENATALVNHLARRPHSPTILVSLSKGGADVRAALARPGATAELRDVRTWVNLSGMAMGTPLVAWLRARPVRCWGVRLLLRVRRQRFAVLDELRRGAGAPLDGIFQLPPHLRAIHVVGFPLVRHLSNDWARRGHARLTPLGPNDGGGILLADALRLPGHLYPVWGADHYLQPGWDIRPLLRRILWEAARSCATTE
jgi:hypothetical protein